eukprot:15360980-Alexandrium_andersonii.AAC.1
MLASPALDLVSLPVAQGISHSDQAQHVQDHVSLLPAWQAEPRRSPDVVVAPTGPADAQGWGRWCPGRLWSAPSIWPPWAACSPPRRRRHGSAAAGGP